jgi:hypothetical protein
MHRLKQGLPFLPVVTGAISTALFVAQGGFGGGHSKLDFVIVILGLPSILLNLFLPNGFSLPDILLIVWIPALVNSLLFLALGYALSWK